MGKIKWDTAAHPMTGRKAQRANKRKRRQLPPSGPVQSIRARQRRSASVARGGYVTHAPERISVEAFNKRARHLAVTGLYPERVHSTYLEPEAVAARDRARQMFDSLTPSEKIAVGFHRGSSAEAIRRAKIKAGMARGNGTGNHHTRTQSWGSRKRITISKNGSGNRNGAAAVVKEARGKARRSASG